MKCTSHYFFFVVLLMLVQSSLMSMTQSIVMRFIVSHFACSYMHKIEVQALESMFKKKANIKISFLSTASIHFDERHALTSNHPLQSSLSVEMKTLR